MAFVKDDHSFTRGPGAIAAMDAASPARRLAAARAERALQVRDALAQRAISTLAGVHHGKPPPYHNPHDQRTKPPKPGKPVRPPSRGSRIPPPRGGTDLYGRFPTDHKPSVKLPGSVITPPAPGDAKPSQSSGEAAPAATKGSTTIIGGGSGSVWQAPPKAPPPGVELDTAPPEVDIPDTSEAPAAAPAAPAKAPSKLLLYAALGIGAWWLLTRK